MVYYDCKKESPQRVLGVRLISNDGTRNA